MRLDLRPIFSALMCNRVGAVLVAIQIAIALAVLVNAIYIVKQRVDTIRRPDGIDTANIFTVASTGFAQKFDYAATVREDIAYLNSLPDVIAAATAGQIPLSGGGSSTSIYEKPGEQGRKANMNYFEMDEHGIPALGTKLAAGRNFTANEIRPDTDNKTFAPQIIIALAVAKDLFGDENALGKTVYTDLGQSAVVIGLIEHMHGSWVGWDKLDHVAIVPQIPEGPSVKYLVRTKPGRRDAIMALVEEHLTKSNTGRVLSRIRTLEKFKSDSYEQDRNMAIFLVAVTVLLLAITLLGIFGLATFNVSTRTKQIGTRRAIGARRGDIVSYFMVENWLITTAGVVVGSLLALGIGYWLSVQLQLPRLDLYYLVGGTLVVWLIGQIAAWQPARRAAMISPAVATRTV